MITASEAFKQSIAVSRRIETENIEYITLRVLPCIEKAIREAIKTGKTAIQLTEHEFSYDVSCKIPFLLSELAAILKYYGYNLNYSTTKIFATDFELNINWRDNV